MKKQNNEKFWLNLWKFLGPSQRKMKFLFFAVCIYELTRLASPYILKRIIDKISNFNEKELFPILFLVAIMFFTEEIISVIGYFKDRFIFKTLIEIEYYLPVRAHAKLMELPLSYHEKENTGAKMTRIEKGLNKISELVGNMSFEVVPTIVQLIITIITLFIIDWRLGMSIAFFAPLFIFSAYKINKNLRPIRKERYKNNEISWGKMAESIININTVKSFTQEERETTEFKSLRKKIKDAEIFEWFKVLKLNLGRNLFIDLGRITLLFLGIYLLIHKSITIGTLVFIITLSEKAYLSLFRISRFYDRVQEGREGVRRLVNLTKVESNIKDPARGLKPKSITGEIKFNNVSFTYLNGGKALSRLNLKINSGCITALVGPSGGGKTTLARMIYRHYDPQEGDVLLDGKNLKDYSIKGFRKFIAIVPQESEIFNASVRDNIAYADKKSSFKEVRAAARIANAEEFVLKLAGGYDALVGERGIKLSGGQRQRIGIARAVLANPKILIFDEATSNLDSYNEKLIQEAILRVSKGRTMIIIAHRLSTIQKADKIIVLENGRVAEEGSHYELAKASSGLYAKLLKLQEMGDIE